MDIGFETISVNGKEALIGDNFGEFYKFLADLDLRYGNSQYILNWKVLIWMGKIKLDNEIVEFNKLIWTVGSYTMGDKVMVEINKHGTTDVRVDMMKYTFDGSNLKFAILDHERMIQEIFEDKN